MSATLEHPALLHGSTQEFLDFMAPFVGEGVDRGEPVFVAVGGELVEALRAALGRRSERIGWAVTDAWYPNPLQRLRAFHELVLRELTQGARRVRLVGEPLWPPGEPELAVEWQRYESVLNEVLAALPVTLVCTYDASRLEEAVLATARRTHRSVYRGGERCAGDYVAPADFLRGRRAPLSPVPPSALRLESPRDLGAARRVLAEQALAFGLSTEQSWDLCLAASEVLGNALRHGGGAAELLAWSERGSLLCQIRDRGGGIADALAGYRPPDARAESGRGLWMARQIVDLLQIESGESGTTVRLRVRRPAA